jgi:hypothetical protein
MASGEKRGDGGGENEEVLEDTALRLLHREALDLVLSISQVTFGTLNPQALSCVKYSITFALQS